MNYILDASSSDHRSNSRNIYQCKGSKAAEVYAMLSYGCVSSCRQWTFKTLSRPYEVHYDPFSQTVHVLDSVHKLEGLAASLSTEVLRLNNALAKMKF